MFPYNATLKITEFMIQNDIDFDDVKFLEWSKNLFITLQTAWTQRDWEKIRTFEKEELFEQHNTQVTGIYPSWQDKCYRKYKYFRCISA